MTEPANLGHVIDTVKNAEKKEIQDPKTISVTYNSGTEKEEVFYTFPPSEMTAR